MINEPIDWRNLYVPPPVEIGVRKARLHLMQAQYALDDFGYTCTLLERLHDGAAQLLAEWAGRQRPTHRPPAHVADAAREYRRANRRSY